MALIAQDLPGIGMVLIFPMVGMVTGLVALVLGLAGRCLQVAIAASAIAAASSVAMVLLLAYFNDHPVEALAGIAMHWPTAAVVFLPFILGLTPWLRLYLRKRAGKPLW